MSGSARCRSCGRPIWWAQTMAGKSIPIIAKGTGPKAFPADESNKGRIQEAGRVESLFGDSEVLVRVLTEDEEPDPALPVWRSHFWDCPHAEEWRAEQRRSRPND